MDNALNSLLLALCIIALYEFAFYVSRKSRKQRAERAYSLTEKAVLNTTASRVAVDSVRRKLDHYSNQISRRQTEHLEMFAAAYMKTTGISPKDAELVQEFQGQEKVVWYFRPKPTSATNAKSHSPK